MLVISVIAFSIQDNLGDPLRELVGQSVSEAERQSLRNQMGLNDPFFVQYRSEEHTSELQSRTNLVCRLLLEKKKKNKQQNNKNNNNHNNYHHD